MMMMGSYGQTCMTPSGRFDTAGFDKISDEINRHHNAIVGLERRLAGAIDDGDEDDGDCVARSAVTRHYAAFAVGMVRRMGGDVSSLRALTDRNNAAPLAGAALGAVINDQQGA